MKLWLKIALLSTIMVIAAVGICSLVMLISAGQNSIQMAVNHAIDSLRITTVSWSTAMKAELDGSYTPAAKRSFARHLIDNFGGKNVVLISEEDVIYNRTPYDPQITLKLEGHDARYMIADRDGKTLMTAGFAVSDGEQDYAVYSITDMTSVYAEVKEMSGRFSFINFIVILSFAAVVPLLVRRLLKPVAELKKNTGLIADGIYEQRVTVKESDEIGELAYDFNRMADAVENKIFALREEAERRTLFMSALAHELKTPMTAIKGNTQTLLATKMDEDEQADALMRIDRACTRIERLSEKLMQLIVLRQADEIELTSQKVSELFDTVLAICSQQLKSRNLFLCVENSMDTLAMDKDLLCSLILNLIDNAGKASRAGDTIYLRAEPGVISVTDHGCGIPERELSRITQPFYMGDKSRSRKAGGMGLGLALAEEIARLHGARIEIDSVLGRGTTVKVVFEDEE